MHPNRGHLQQYQGTQQAAITPSVCQESQPPAVSQSTQGESHLTLGCDTPSPCKIHNDPLFFCGGGKGGREGFHSFLREIFFFGKIWWSCKD